MYSRRHFPNQKPNEHVLMFLRRHWIVPLKILFVSLLLSLIPFVIYVALVNYTETFLDSELYMALFTLLISAFYLFIILFTFANFVDYYLDVWMVTNMRIINIEQKGLFSRVVSEKDLGIMQDITFDSSGFWPTVLHYGNIHIQTAGQEERFIFHQVPFADEVAQRISNLVTEYRKIERTIDAENL